MAEECEPTVVAQESRHEARYDGLRNTSFPEEDRLVGCSTALVCFEPTAYLWCRIIHLPWRWRRYVPPKRRFKPDPHGAISHRTIFFIVIAWKPQILRILSYLHSFSCFSQALVSCGMLTLLYSIQTGSGSNPKGPTQRLRETWRLQGQSQVCPPPHANPKPHKYIIHI
jgi:hypothetical protein